MTFSNGTTEHVPSLSPFTQAMGEHAIGISTGDIFQPHSLSNQSFQPHLPTPNSPNQRMISLPQNTFDTPSRSGSDEQYTNKSTVDVLSPRPFMAHDLTARLPQTNGNSRSKEDHFSVPLLRRSQMVTPESSPLPRESAGLYKFDSSLTGMHRSTPMTLAPAPIISPSSGRRTAQLLADNLVATPDSPTPYSSARPDYMRRFKRSRTNSASDREDTAVISRPGSRNSSDNLEIAVSPTKGRRLRLFESKTSRLEGSPAYDPPLILDSMVNSRPRTPEISEESMQRIEKRMIAFSTPSSSHSPLFPVVVPGKGRVLINRATGLDFFASSSSTSRRLNAKKAGKGKRTIERSYSSPAPSSRDAESLQQAIAATTSWPDQEFPWSVHNDERLKRKDQVHQEKLAKIRRFLEHDSDGEDEDECEPPSVARNPYSVDRGHDGEQTIPVQSRRPNSSARVRSFNAVMESADAKEVLRASKFASATAANKSMSRLHEGSTFDSPGAEMEEEEDGVLNCICGTHEDRPMVRCDGCKFWYHQNCMGIQNEDDLDEEWFCFACANLKHQARLLQEPTLVPTNEETSFTKPNTHLPLYQTDDMLMGTPRARTLGNNQLSSFFQTPKAESSNNHRNLAYQSQSSSSNPSSPYRFSNKSDIKVWATPSLFEDVATAAAPDSPFDPTSTPSRGMKFGIPLISTATPKDFGAWSSRVGGLFATPFQVGRSNHTSDTGRRTLDLSDFTPGMPSWNNSPLALVSGTTKGQILEFGGDLVPNVASNAGSSSTAQTKESISNGIVPAAEIQSTEASI